MPHKLWMRMQYLLWPLGHVYQSMLHRYWHVGINMTQLVKHTENMYTQYRSIIFTMCIWQDGASWWEWPVLLKFHYNFFICMHGWRLDSCGEHWLENAALWSLKCQLLFTTVRSKWLDHERDYTNSKFYWSTRSFSIPLDSYWELTSH